MIAIKGMEMPENCSDCDLCHGHICKITGTDIVTNPKGNCPLVEIVTCKDCKHLSATHSCNASRDHRICPPDFYCADAERRE